jgi:hypothetical protein
MNVLQNQVQASALENRNQQEAMIEIPVERREDELCRSIRAVWSDILSMDLLQFCIALPSLWISVQGG